MGRNRITLKIPPTMGARTTARAYTSKVAAINRFTEAMHYLNNLNVASQATEKEIEKFEKRVERYWTSHVAQLRRAYGTVVDETIQAYEKWQKDTKKS